MGFAIITDARRGRDLGIEILALIDRKKTTEFYWTGDKASKIMHYRTEEAALDRCAKLKKGNPRVVPFKHAKWTIRTQSEKLQAKLRKRKRKQSERGKDRRSTVSIPDLGI